MEFLNLGWPEILLIFTLAFIVLGPDRIKKFGGELGAFLRKMSKDGLFREVVQTTDELRNYPRKILNEAMLDQAGSRLMVSRMKLVFPAPGEAIRLMP